MLAYRGLFFSDLDFTDFSQSLLIGADFTNASISTADFQGADLTDVIADDRNKQWLELQTGQ